MIKHLVFLAILPLIFTLSFKLDYNADFCFIDDIYEDAVFVILMQIIELKYEILFPDEAMKNHYLINAKELTKTNSGIRASIVQPSGEIKYFSLEMIKGIIKFPVEDRNSYNNTNRRKAQDLFYKLGSAEFRARERTIDDRKIHGHIPIYE